MALSTIQSAPKQPKKSKLEKFAEATQIFAGLGGGIGSLAKTGDMLGLLNLKKGK